MKKRQLCLTALVIVTSALFIGCSTFNAENLDTNNQTEPTISKFQINKDNLYKSIQNCDVSIQAVDKQSIPISGAFVCIRIKETSDCIFKSITGEEGLVSGTISVSLSEPELVIEVFAPNHFNKSQKVTISNNQQKLQLVVQLQKATEVQFAEKPTDSDNDGTPDMYDEFPDNSKASFEIKYPSHILAYEDLYPNNIKDFDMNDLVVKVEMNQIIDHKGNTHQIKGKTKLLARGTSHSEHSDFKIRIIHPDLRNYISHINIKNYNHYKQLSESEIVINNEDSLTIPVFLDTASGFHKPIYKNEINTMHSWAKSDGNSTDFIITFSESINLNLDKAYDPYLYVLNPDHGVYYDIHRPCFPYIPKSNNPDQEPHCNFIDDNNKPYSLMITSTDWMWVKEGVTISEAYPYYDDWIKSKFGLTESWTNNWFMYPNPDLLFVN